MVVSIEIRVEALAPNKYRAVGLRPDGSEYFCFGGLWDSSHAEKKAEDYIRSVQPNAAIRWETQPGIEDMGQVLYRGAVTVREEA
jgi:hypothetical protein